MEKYPYLAVFRAVKIFHAAGVRDAVISPGSRNAPLTVALSHFPEMRCRSVVDERSAAFVALGIAEQSGRPVVLCCTSGTAGLNYASAVAEAFYKQIPLIICTADRPPELIDQADGQAIRQQNMYAGHCKKSFAFPVDYLAKATEKFADRMASEAVLEAVDLPAGPVHLNFPFREPFYPEKVEKSEYGEPKIIRRLVSKTVLSEEGREKLLRMWNAAERILIVPGQGHFPEETIRLAGKKNVPIVADAIANFHVLKNRIRHQDAFLRRPEICEEIGRPDLLITFGKSLISKNLKLFLRKYSPKDHIHFGPGYSPDTFQSLSFFTAAEPADILEMLPPKTGKNAKFYFQKWANADQPGRKFKHSFFAGYALSEAEATARFLKKLPSDSVLHISNSMPVRMVNFLGIPAGGPTVFANRGTSGIDGSSSTAVGHALASPEKQHFLLTGDLSFFYDQNALWNGLPDNLKILMINNGGGNIFRAIPGPQKLEKSAPFFVTTHSKSAKYICKENQISYLFSDEKERFKVRLKKFLRLKTGAILEVRTSPENDNLVRKALFAALSGV